MTLYDDIRNQYREPEPFRITIYNAFLPNVVITPLLTDGRRCVITEIFISWQRPVGLNPAARARVMVLPGGAPLHGGILLFRGVPFTYRPDVPIEVPPDAVAFIQFTNANPEIDITASGYVVLSN